MCGRYVQTKRARDHARLLAIREEMEAPLPETWNLAPSTRSLVIRARPTGLASGSLSWGFHDSVDGPVKPVNARIDTAASKSLFREAWKTRRCVIPADGWYEWQKTRNEKQPYHFYQKNGEPLFFAGLWAGETFAVLTTAAEGDLARIHDRRPLAFGVDRGREWGEQLPKSEGSVVAGAVSAAEIAFHPVSPDVNSPRTDGPELIQPIAVSDGPRQDDLLWAFLPWPGCDPVVFWKWGDALQLNQIIMGLWGTHPIAMNMSPVYSYFYRYETAIHPSFGISRHNHRSKRPGESRTPRPKTE